MALAIKAPVERGEWVRITPAGIERNRRPFQERIRQFGTDIRRVLLITRAEMRATHFGKSLGWLWLILEPLFLAFMYWFITAVLFDLRKEDTNRFVTILALVIFWLWFSRSLNIAPMTFQSYAAMLRDTDFSVGMAFAITMAKELVGFLFGFVIVLGFLVAFKIHLGMALIALPVVAFVQLVLIISCSMLLAVAGTFIKDLTAILGQLLQIIWYCSPALYPAATAQHKLGHFVWILKLNPFWWIFPAYESILINNTIPDLHHVLLLFVVCLFPLALGVWIFHRARYYYYHFL